MNTIIDRYTFGKTPAALNLVKILNELNDSKITAKVERFLSSQQQIIKGVSSIEDRKIRRYVLGLLVKNIESGLTLPYKVKTHMYNIIRGRIRAAWID